MLNFVFIRGLVSSILVSGVQKPPKPSNLCQKIDFSGEQKVAAHEGGRRRNGTGRIRTWGKFRGMGVKIVGGGGIFLHSFSEEPSAKGQFKSLFFVIGLSFFDDS